MNPVNDYLLAAALLSSIVFCTSLSVYMIVDAVVRYKNEAEDRELRRARRIRDEIYWRNHSN